MATLCVQNTHIIHKLPNGTYICVQCWLKFHEHAEVMVGGGANVAPQVR